ncbi:MAG: histidine phosphatase family protein [Kiritimatiellae bacterium]|nr:histidine phosphatase family protein [Kiritimatiellia bacterium]
MSGWVSDIRRLYGEYVNGYRVDGVLPPMMALKLHHTDMVVANAKAIIEGEGMDAETAEVCELAALLHDTGRYEQLRRYNTFRDSDSIDHAVFSHDIVREKGWLDGHPHKDAILNAVLFHNRRDVPDGLDPLTLAAAHCTRDADKLDIFRVLEDRVANTDWRNDNTAFWNLPVMAAPNREVLSAIREGRPVDYQNIKTLADFVLIQVGWIRGELHFGASRNLASIRGHLAFRRRFLAELTGNDPEVDELCCRQPLGEITLDDVNAELKNGSRVLLLVRHGERPKIDNEDPTFGEALPLTAEGLRTSREMGARLKEFAGDVQFLSSPLLRTVMTASGIAEGMGLHDVEIPTDILLGNDTFYCADQHEVFELFRDGNFFEKVFEYLDTGVQRGFRQITEATDALEEWALGKFTAKLGIFTTHDLYNAAFLHERGVKRDWCVSNWVRFLDSVAIILDEDGTRRYAFLRTGLSTGIVGVPNG